MLSPYRVLDLSDHKGFLCGAILGGLGADVIKVEPPGGDPARSIAPLFKTNKTSLLWLAYNVNKRGITLDLKKTAGQQRFKDLVKTADIVIESFPPGELKKIGLDHENLSRVNPALITVSITPFGQTGPYAAYQASDLVMNALGGYLYIHGDADRPPVRVGGAPQSYLHAGLHGAIGALVALHHREATGQGQQVDLSIQESVTSVMQSVAGFPFYEIQNVIVPRMGSRTRRESIVHPEVFPCQDGYVCVRLTGGLQGRGLKGLLEWMDSQGKLASLKEMGEPEKLNMRKVKQEQIDKWEQDIIRFLKDYGRAELYREALDRRIYLMPSYTVKDIFEDKQLAARDFWVDLPHPELNRRVKYPGAPFKLSTHPWKVSRRAPLIGEHNDEIFDGMKALKAGAGHKKRAVQRDPEAGALAGVKILDFGRVGVGPLVTRVLADFGATVVKLESRSNPDAARTQGPYRDNIPGLDRGGGFAQYNTSKYSICVNLNTAEGLEIAKDLVRWADVVVENFAPGFMQRRGLDYATLRKIKKDIIMVQASALGQTGPNATQPGFGFNLKGLAGMVETTGWPDRPPCGPSDPYTDFIGPWFGSVAVLAALDHRKRTGEGQAVDLSQLEAALTFMAPALLDYSANGVVETRKGNASDSACPHGVYPCKGVDRWCAISVCTREQWQGFCRAAVGQSWLKDRRFTTLAGRKRHEAELEALVAAWTIGFEAYELMDRLQSAGVPAGVAQTIADLMHHDPQLQHRGYFQVLEAPQLGPFTFRLWPAHLSRTPARLRRHPLLAEHNEFVCKTFLHMSDAEIAGAFSSGALEK